MSEMQTDVQVEQVSENQVAETATGTSEQKLTNKEIIAFLAEKFPACFSVEGEAKPLKIGIFQDLAQALQDDNTVSKTQLRQALRQYTSNWRYLHGCRLGAERVDLQGQIVGVLEQEHVDHAAQQLAEAKAKFAEKRAAEKATKPKKRVNARPTTRSPTKNSNGKPKRDNKPRSPKLDLTPVDFAILHKDSKVKVKFGDNAKHAQVLDINKDGARVQLENGLIVTVSPDRLFA
ncbi:MAG: RNA chaperone ProQ [Pasteurellaceae bacterium]|nr:RNA chaperone ProQ [Pasteurellaceae bacterium]